MQVVNVGPWVLSIGVLALLLGFGAAHATAGFLRRRGYADVGPALWWLLAGSLLVARAAYVVRWWPAFQSAPWWSVLDIRDAGFARWVGIIVLVVATLVVAARRPAWQRALPVAVGSGLAVWALVGLIAWQLQAAAHPPLPELALRRLDGSPVALTALRGKPMVINLWATWCGPCRREMPMLMDAAEDIQGVRFVFADQGESAPQVRSFLRRGGLSARHILLDSGRALTRYYHVPGYPATLFVDAEGRLRDMRVGPLSRATLHEHLAFLTPRPSGAEK